MKRMLTVRVTDEFYEEIVDLELDISTICRRALEQARDTILDLQRKSGKKETAK
jgi:hypothetical protein